jgi:cation diffusion facilitator family transporter
MTYQSVARLIAPSPIRYEEAIAIAVIGLGVNALCAWWLRGHHDHDHDHGHEHAHDHEAPHAHAHHHDLNARSAYLHVLADAATSVLAIAALLGGRIFGAAWLDPVMGLAGAVLVAAWAWNLLHDSGKILLDAEMDAPVVAEIRDLIEHGAAPARITDLHVWRVGREKYAVVVTVATSSGKDGEYFRRALCVHEELAHVTVEIETVASPGN